MAWFVLAGAVSNRFDRMTLTVTHCRVAVLQVDGVLVVQLLKCKRNKPDVCSCTICLSMEGCKVAVKVVLPRARTVPSNLP